MVLPGYSNPGSAVARLALIRGLFHFFSEIVVPEAQPSRRRDGVTPPGNEKADPVDVRVPLLGQLNLKTHA
jgi:hypothetical protein